MKNETKHLISTFIIILTIIAVYLIILLAEDINLSKIIESLGATIPMTVFPGIVAYLIASTIKEKEEKRLVGAIAFMILSLILVFTI